MKLEATAGQQPGSWWVKLGALTLEAANFSHSRGRQDADVIVYLGDALVHRDRTDLGRAEMRAAFVETLTGNAAVDGVTPEDLHRALLLLGEADRKVPGHQAATQTAGTPLDQIVGSLPEDLADLVRGLVLPMSYELDAGVVRRGEVTITTTAVLPVFEIDDLELGGRLLGCLIRVRGQWRLETLPRSELLDRKRVITRLAGLGVDVASGSEALLIGFLQAYLRANGDRLGLRRRTSRLGFHRVDDRLVCVLWEVHGGTGDLAFNTDIEEARVRHAALEPRGTLAAWTACIERVLEFPIVVFTLLMALVPALRELLGLPMKSCVVYLLERSTTGKSAAQEIACSPWAQPGEAWIKSAHGTYAGVEALLLSTYGLPAFFEEAHLLPAEILKQLIYAIANEHFKARGGDRRRVQAHCHCVAILSGELPIVHGGSLPGEAARVMTVRGLPFGEQSEERGSFVNEIRANVRAHYGHLGPALVKELIDATTAERAALVGEWEVVARAFATAAGSHALLGRQASYYAAATLAAKLVAELTGLPTAKLVAAVDAVFELAKAQAVVPSPARCAAELLVSELESHRHACAVWDSGKGEYRQPLGARQFGVINEAENFAAIFTSIAHEVLRRHDLQSHQLLEAMREQGLLLPDRKKGFTAQVWHLGHRPRMFRLPYPLPGDADDEAS